MTILTTKKTWGRTLALRRAPDLTPEEIANVQRALAFLRIRLGGYRQLGAALGGVGLRRLQHLGSRRGRPGAGLAVRVARLAKVAVDDVLAGRFPSPTACAHCGRG